MRILLSTRSPIPAPRGDSVYILELIEHLEIRGHHLDVFAHLTQEPHFYTRFQSDFHQVDSFVSDTRRMTTIVREKGIEVIHGFFHLYSDSGFYSSYQTKIPFVCELPDDPITAMMLASRAQPTPWSMRIANVWLQTLLQGSNCRIVQSHTLAAYYERFYHIRVDRVLPLSVPLDVFDRQPALDLRRQLDIQDEEICVFFVGDFVYWHGGETLARTIPLVSRENQKVNFLLIGGFSHLAYDQMKERLAQLGDSAKNVILLRDIPYAEMPDYHSIADISLAPHVNPLDRPLGCSPRKIFEYMASGKPVICSDLPEIREIVDESFGLFVRPGDPQDLADKILSLAADSGRRQKMGYQARKKAEKLFDVNNRVGAITDIYQTLQGKNSNAGLWSALKWMVIFSNVYHQLTGRLRRSPEAHWRRD